MNDIVNKFLLLGDKCMAEMYLRQPGFTYSACGPFTENKERVEKFMQSGNTDFIKMSLIKHVFNMIWPMVNQKICLKELNQIKF